MRDFEVPRTMAEARRSRVPEKTVSAKGVHPRKSTAILTHDEKVAVRLWAFGLTATVIWALIVGVVWA